MIAAIGVHLHQPIDDVEEWEADKFFAFFDRIEQLYPPQR